ncbi:MAG: tRNA (adenosine(37)-N6)-threonylcarbamoyltransferase complex dimerization subunit type 1 TsaB [Gemmatimonadaceae bacterium]|nr:tRNA (adenosine(37)-N6)-threonylcarbamoyltransferase complex dimerization subunit type 1 TsaB [Gemmatimonadaceae bacterium]
MQSLSFADPVLILEAATSAGSVALLQDGAPDVVRLVTMGVGREDHLFPAIQSVLAERGVSPSALGAVVCGAGPGSFTSLRIAAALAKGLAHGGNVPLYAVPSLALAAGALPADAPAGRYVVHADALRGERYALPVIRSDDGMIAPAGELARVSVDALATTSTSAERIAVGPPIADLVSDWHVDPSAGALRLVGGAWREASVSLADWEPDYGRLAEAQVKWEAAHGTTLPASVLRPTMA